MAKRGKGYQGREITATLQAPDMEQLEMMLHEMNDYTAAIGVEPIEILKIGPDPDGGYKAVIVAHNFNPIKWLKEKYEERGFTAEEKASLKSIKKQVKFQKVRAKRVAGGAAEVRAEAAKAAREEYARRGLVPKKYKVEAEIPIYGVRTLEAEPVPVFEPTKAPKEAEKVVVELTESGKTQAQISEDPLFLELLDGPKTIEYLAETLVKTPKTMLSYIKSLTDMKLVRMRPARTELVGERLYL